jgi:hemoglobin-like flavoprotein
VTFADRIRRIIMGPTEEEISAESQALGGPPYPIPHMDMNPPTHTTGFPPDEPPNPRARFATGGYVAPPIETYVRPGEEIIRAGPLTQRAAAALETLNPGNAGVIPPPRPIDTPAGRAASLDYVRDYHARQAATVTFVGRDHPTDEQFARPGHVPDTTAQIVADAGSAIPPVGRAYHVPNLDNPQGEPVTGPTEYDNPDYYPSTGRRRLADVARPAAPNTTPTPADPDPLTDTGTHPGTEDLSRAIRINCPTCEGHGYVTKTVNDLLRESLALLGDNGDAVIREFYNRLLTAAPDLAPLFPADLLNEDTTHHQRDRLLKALIALSELYDPNNPDSMDRLETALRAFGRSHAAFQRPDGTVRGATMREYVAVADTLLGTLRAVAGDAWIDAYDDAWDEAYYHAADIMRDEQRRTAASFPRYPRQAV